jgi:hypothetical protein
MDWIMAHLKKESEEQKGRKATTAALEISVSKEEKEKR